MVGFSEASYSVGEGDGSLAVTLFARTSAGAPEPPYEVHCSPSSVDLGTANAGTRTSGSGYDCGRSPATNPKMKEAGTDTVLATR